VHGWFPSLKLGRLVAFHSAVARDYLYLLDYDPAVITFQEHPGALEYTAAGRRARYTPDFQLRQRARDVLVACTVDDAASASADRPEFTAARAWCAARQMEFRIVTAAQLRQGWRLANIKLLTYYARQPVPPQLEIQVYARLAVAGAPLPLLALLEAIHPDHPRAAYPAVLHLLFHGRLWAPLDAAPLSDGTPVALSPAVSPPEPWL
jgi:hypothetical protein